MLAKRIIPCLDVNAGRVVKGVKFIGLRDAGDPVEIARIAFRCGDYRMNKFDVNSILIVNVPDYCSSPQNN